MKLWELILTSVGLSMGAFAIAICKGIVCFVRSWAILTNKKACRRTQKTTYPFSFSLEYNAIF